MEPKAVIFDADGMVIVGDRPSTRLSRQYGVPLEKINPFFENEFRLCSFGKSDLKEVIAPYLKVWNWKGTVEEFLHFWFAESYRVDERIAQAIRQLRGRGIKCLLATRQEKYRLSFMRKEMGFDELFDAVFATCEIGVKKTEARFFDVIMSFLPGVAKSEVLFWDDRPENIDAARRYGFKAKLFSDTNDFYATTKHLVT